VDLLCDLATAAVILAGILVVDAIIEPRDQPSPREEPDYLDLWARQQQRKILAGR
jgi:hypothetical protein